MAFYTHNLTGESISYELVISSRRKKSIALEIKADWLRIMVPESVSDYHIEKIIQKKWSWIIKKLAQLENLKVLSFNKNISRQQAAQILHDRTLQLGKVTQLSLEKVIIKQYRRKYWQCKWSTVYLDWRIVFFPQEITDHIIYHELAHLRYKHHQKTFWEFLTQLDPATPKHKKWLREYGASIHTIS